MSGITISKPRFEHHHSGLGVSTLSPRISWSFSQDESQKDLIGWEQSSYEIDVRFEGQEKDELFSVKSSDSICVPWPARALKSREQAQVRVRCHGSFENDRTTVASITWSPWATVEAALLDNRDWHAKWIAAPKQEVNDDGSLRPIRLYKAFEVAKYHHVKRARLYITAQGCYDARLNGKPISDECMAPGWQSYKHRLHYQVLDVTALLTDEANTVDVTVAAGWYASALAWAGGRRCFFGDELSLFAQLIIDFDNGSEPQIIISDHSWQVVASPVVSSEIYKGETYDQSLATSSPAELSAREVAAPSAKFISPDSPPVRVTQTIEPQKIFRSRSGKVLIDFGQNLVGRLRIKSFTKAAGTCVQFAHAEVLENDELGRRPLRYATSTDTIVCHGTALEDWTPKFTFHGFRYVEIVGWSPEDAECPLTMDSLEAQVLHTDMRRTGSFECSHPMVNKLHENALWSMRGNFLSLPTDCPQRDERLGWTGDIQVFAPSANFLYDTTGMLGNWLDDLAAEQLSEEHRGVPPFVVPDVISQAHEGDDDYWIKTPNAVWDDAAVIIPWALYTSGGDSYMLQKQLESMTTWLDKGVKRGEDGLWDPELYQLGDWLDPIAAPSEPGNGRTNGTLVADAYLVHITEKLAKACKVLNLTDKAEKYTNDHTRLLGTFQDKYITKAGLIIGDTQTAMALAIMFNLYSSPSQLHNLGERLARSVRLQQFRVATGFAGTPLILHALTKSGHAQHAYRMLLEQRCPSWMYAVSMGATTIWERWDSMLPDGSINPGEMTSFNHYALGSVVNWMHECVGGISPLKEGWKEVLVKPVGGGGLEWANVRYEGPYGLIECSWRVEGDGKVFKMTLRVPPNSRAKVVLPGSDDHRWVGSGIHELDCPMSLDSWPPEAIMPPFWPQPKPVLVIA